MSDARCPFGFICCVTVSATRIAVALASRSRIEVAWRRCISVLVVAWSIICIKSIWFGISSVKILDRILTFICGHPYCSARPYFWLHYAMSNDVQTHSGTPHQDVSSFPKRLNVCPTA